MSNLQLCHHPQPNERCSVAGRVVCGVIALRRVKKNEQL